MDVDGSGIKKPPGPDQGFAWVIALACFSINFLLIGMARSVSVLYMALIDLYGVNRASATLPFTVRVSVRNLTGPFIGILGQKYGIRKIASIGGFVAALGSVLCAFAPNVTWIIVAWGVVHGLGFGLCTVLHMMIINHYFDKYRASAFGLSYSGDCFGTFVFPLIIEALLSAYDVKGTFLILGGIMLNVIPLTLLLKKPSWSKINRETTVKPLTNVSENVVAAEELKESNEYSFEGHTNKAFLNPDTISIKSDASSGKAQLFTLNEIEDSPNLRKLVMTKCGMDVLNRKYSPESSLRLSKQGFQQNSRHYSLPPTIPEDRTNNETKNATSDRHIIVSPSNQKRRYTETLQPEQKMTTSFKTRRKSSFSQMARGIAHTMRNASFASLGASDGFLFNVYEQDENKKEVIKPPRIQIRRHTEAPYRQRDVNLGAPPRRMSSFSQMARRIGHTMRSASSVSQVASDGFVANIQQGFDGESGKQSNSEYDRKDSKLSSSTDGKQTADEDNNQYEMTDQEPEEQPNIFRILLQTNIKPMFLLISSTMAAYGFLFVGLLTIIVDYANDMGICHENAKLLIIIFSVTDLIGRLSFGVVIDRKVMKLKNYAFMTMFLMGTLVAIIPLHASFYYIIACICLYGFIQGGTAIMFPMLIGNYLDKREYSVAMGCLNFYGGLLVLLMAPMIGYFRDNTGSYKFVFFIIGGLSAFVGLLWQLEPCIMKFQTKKLEQKQLKTSDTTKL